MNSIPLFGDCDLMTVQGVKNIKLATKLENGNSIHYPLDYLLKADEESTIIAFDKPEEQLISVDADQILQYVEPSVLNASFNEVQIKDRRGKYYETMLEFEFSKIDLFTNAQVKDFMFDENGNFAIANATIFITDNNDVDWIIGYDLPMVIEDFELTTGGADNKYSMTLKGKSYNRIRRLEYIPRVLPTDFILTNPIDFLLIDSLSNKFYI